MVKKYSKKDSCSSSVFTIFVIIIGSILWGDGNELWKTKRGFCQQHNHSQNTLSVLQQLLSFERFEFIFVAYFQGLNYLIISRFSHKFAARIPINWRGILINKKRFLFIKYSFKKKISQFLHRCLGSRDMKASLRPKFPEIRQISPNLICYFWVNYI